MSVFAKVTVSFVSSVSSRTTCFITSLLTFSVASCNKPLTVLVCYTLCEWWWLIHKSTEVLSRTIDDYVSPLPIYWLVIYIDSSSIHFTINNFTGSKIASIFRLYSSHCRAWTLNFYFSQNLTSVTKLTNWTCLLSLKGNLHIDQSKVNRVWWNVFVLRFRVRLGLGGIGIPVFNMLLDDDMNCVWTVSNTNKCPLSALQKPVHFALPLICKFNFTKIRNKQ